MSQQESIPQANHRPGLSPGDYHRRWSYHHYSPLRTHPARNATGGAMDPDHNPGAETTGRDCCNRHHGVSDKNHGATGPVYPGRVERSTSPEQQRPYRRQRSTPRLHRGFVAKTGSHGLHNAPVTPIENIRPPKRPIQLPQCRSERDNQSYQEIPLGPSNATATSPPPASPHEARPFQSFYLADSFEQRRRDSESSDGTDAIEGCFTSQNTYHKGEPTYNGLPHKTRSTSKQIRQDLHRCALAAAALQLERSKLMTEWKKLRREQETLLNGQRRLRYNWQSWKQRQQHQSDRNDESKSMGSSNETESSSKSDYAETSAQKSQHHHTENSGAGYSRPSAAFEHTNHDPRMLLDQYNRQWSTLLSGSSTDTPWPTADLKAAALSKPHLRTPRALLRSANPQDLLKWNALNFFTSAFGSRATLKQTANGIVMNISTTSLEVVKAMRNQAREDIKRWHQDKLGCRDGELASDERAKAVFAAVYDLYGVCSERIRTA